MFYPTSKTLTDQDVRIRKVKCDETKPSCIRCIKTGRKCDGYLAPALRPSATSAAASRTITGSSRAPRTLPELDSPEAVRAFDFYRNRSVLLIGGTTGGKGSDGADFWGGLVIKLAVEEPAVRHAVLALSSLHERVCMPKHDRIVYGSERTSFGFSEYGKAIAAVRAWGPTDMSTEPAAVPLLVCVLFICIEFLTNYEAAAQVHILQGRRILSKLDPAERSSPTMGLIKRVLVPLYTRLSLASFLYGTRPEKIPSGLIREETAGTADGRGEVPLIFETMTEAKDTLFWLVEEGLRFSTSGKPAVYNPQMSPEGMQTLRETQQWILTQFSRWNAAFIVLKTMLPLEGSSTTGKTTGAVQDLLMVFYHASVIWVSTALTPHELAYDAHIPAFAAIISHASSVVAASSSASSPQGGSSFTFETEIVAPVYWVATKCRHPLLRRAALRLLGRKEVQRRRENLWRADVTYAVAKVVMEMEEEGTEMEMGHFDEDMNMDFFAMGELSSSSIDIPISNPPSLPRPRLDISEDRLPVYDMPLSAGGMNSSDATTVASSSARSSPSAGGSPASRDGAEALASLVGGVDAARLVAPFGLSEERRIKNTIIADVEKGGQWITTFRNPKEGEEVWDVKKMFVKI